MLPKVQGAKEALEHRGLTIFSVLWRIESAAWFSKLKAWQEQWIHRESTEHALVTNVSMPIGLSKPGLRKQQRRAKGDAEQHSIM